MNCVECGRSVPIGYLVSGICPICQSAPEYGADSEVIDESSQAEAPTYKHILVTTECGVGLDFKDRIDVIGSECVRGTGILSDMGAMIRDVVGGRSGDYEKSLRLARRSVLIDLRRQASELGGDAVVAIQFSHSDISGSGKSMLMVTGTGTVVTLSQSPKSD